MEKWKKVTRTAYENHADEYMEQTKDYWEKFPDAKRMMDLFLAFLPGDTVLDIGSGGGRDSAIFQEQGLRPIALDISQEMVSIANKRGIESVMMDFEHLGFQDTVADGIWAYASFLHLPHKKLLPVLREFNRILKQKGVLLVSILEGEGEEYRESPERWASDVRYFALWQEGNLRKVLAQAGFKTVEINRPQGKFIDILAVKTEGRTNAKLWTWARLEKAFAKQPEKLQAYMQFPTSYGSFDEWQETDDQKCDIVTSVVGCGCVESLKAQQREAMAYRRTICGTAEEWIEQFSDDQRHDEPIRRITRRYARKKQCHRNWIGVRAGVRCYCDNHNH